MRVGGTERLNFIVRLAASGLYFLALHFPISEQEQKVAEEWGFATKGYYSAKKYVCVT